MRLFLDSSCLVARHNLDDERHEEALSQFEHITEGGLKVSKLYCSDYVLDEAVMACRARTRSLKLAVELGKAVLQTRSIIMLSVDGDTFFESWSLFKSYRDATLSFIVCATAVLARKHGMVSIFTFDRGFDRLGFHRIPR